jgi:hypothetical protein
MTTNAEIYRKEVAQSDNTVINYDWYHPQTSSRHTVEEVRCWFTEAGLMMVHEYVDFYGITARGLNRADLHREPASPRGSTTGRRQS